MLPNPMNRNIEGGKDLTTYPILQTLHSQIVEKINV